jgi:hypothetical protein
MKVSLNTVRIRSILGGLSGDAGVMLPGLSLVVTITDLVTGIEDVSTDQGKIPGLKIEQTVSTMPGKVTLWLDYDGWLLRQIVPGPFGDIEVPP